MFPRRPIGAPNRITLAALRTQGSDFVFLMRMRMSMPVYVIVLIVVAAVVMIVQRVAVIVIVHQFLRHIREQLARRGRAATGPLDAALLARSGKEVVPRQR